MEMTMKLTPLAPLPLMLAMACTLETPAPIVAPTAQSFAAAATVADLKALGATKLDAAGITQEVAGQNFEEVGGRWIWNILADGSQNSAATDGSWSEDRVRWTITSDQYCRAAPGNMPKCSDVYQLGDLFRWTEDDGLAEWSVIRQ